MHQASATTDALALSIKEGGEEATARRTRPIHFVLLLYVCGIDLVFIQYYVHLHILYGLMMQISNGPNK